jgi:hypothetical protein
MWGIVRWLVRPTTWNLIIAAVLNGISAYAMAYLRFQAVFLFGVYVLLAFFSWYFSKKLSAVRLIAGSFAACVLLVTFSYLVSYMQSLHEVQTRGMMGYYEHAAYTHSGDSLGMSLVVNQPLPIRLILGSGALMVNPIPLWANFAVSSNDYHWIKGYHGIYQVLMLPLVFAGFIEVFRIYQRYRKHASQYFFLALYLVINLAAVVATSLELRHIGQFMPAAIILSALPATRDKKIQKRMRSIIIWWLAVVVFVHLAWFLLKRMV